MSSTIVLEPSRVATCAAGPRGPRRSGRRRDAHGAPRSRSVSARPSPRPAAGRQARSLLIVEDHRHTRELYAEYLTFYGLEVATAPDGHSALTQAWARPPDIIVLDLMLPGIDGWETLRRLKSDPRTAATPVIVPPAPRAGVQRVLDRR